MTTGIQLAPGTIFARDYRVDRLLRQGGMGAVYAVTQVSTNTPRALKLMLPSLLGDTAARQRFTQEAKVGADVQSDHVVHVIAAGVDEDTGAPWLAMELLEGEELGERVARLGPMDRTTARDLFSQLRHALGAAHRSAIVHRDLKPENVFLATSRRSGAVAFDAKVLDFGIAKLTSEARSANTGAMGTPLWMAPEQTEGGRQIAPATDTWAIGLIAYFVLTGRSFWRAASNEDASLPMVFREILFDPIPAASERAAEQGVATLLPFFFDEWFGRCVCRDLSTRFSNADAAIEPFLDMLADQPSTGRTSATSPGANVPALSSTGQPAESEASDERQPNSRSRRVAAFAAIALAAVSVAGLAGWTRRPSPTEAPRAVPSATQVPLWTDVVLAEGILPNEPVDQAATTVVISSKALSIGPPLLRLFGLPGDKSLGAPAEYKRSGPTDLLIVPLAECRRSPHGAGG